MGAGHWQVWRIVAFLSLTISAASASEPDVRALSARIDQRIAERWEQDKITPASEASDAEFLRRAWLDIAGKIPSVSDTRTFLADKDPEKRRQLIDALLDGPNYITHFTTLYRSALLPEVDADFQVRFLIPGFDAWLRQKFTDEARYSDIVREILVQPLSAEASNIYQSSSTLQPIAFYQSKQLKAENLAASTARIFLGVRIECAQCHDHPFDKWKREEFWSFAAFFAGIEREPSQSGLLGSIQEFFDRKELLIPGTKTSVKPAYLDGSLPSLYKSGPRATLAEWMLAKDNPYFARAAVNRLWAHFFGLGIVHPLDDFTSQNPPNHPELLDELAQSFIASDYNLKYLIRALTNSRTYQLSSAESDQSQSDITRFARMPVKGLTAEQLFDSLAQATGYYRPYDAQEAMQFGSNSPRDEFLETFSSGTDAPTERQTTILQALAMMNGQFVADQTSLEKSALLSGVADFPLMTTSERVETLYFATLNRPPRLDELTRLTHYVDEGGAAKDQKKALSDVFWALLNSSEFLFNH